ncbi:pectin acetylesterase 6-like [Branchiostoma floridae]|uniref:Pectin acetylesterase 6-like n=1 Tax=Branchiostoma floridae TaxID=7739 RepID=A0A9J7LQZ0_BRAFL|nr:pectin acetylesterase 6-like [Branchiostoma floridae]
MADGSDVAPLIHQTSGKTCALDVKRRNFSLSVILGVLLVSAVVYFVAQVVFPFAIIRSEQGEYHNHYDRPLFNLPNWLDRGENDTKNKSSTTYGSVREEESVIQVVQVTQGAGVGKELQLDSNCTNNKPDLKSTTAQLYVLSKEEADKTGAYCLDGSPPAYYFKKGSGTGQKSWIVRLQGGGGCVDVASCYNRSLTNYGSSKGLNHQESLHGMLSASKEINPDFYTWNVALLVYCDGFFYTGGLQ